MSHPCPSLFLLEFSWSWFPGVVLVSNVTLSSSLFLVSWGGKDCALCSPVHLKIEQERAALFCSSRSIQHMDTGLSEARLFCALIGAEGGSVNKKACPAFIKITPTKMRSKQRTVTKSRTECGTREGGLLYALQPAMYQARDLVGRRKEVIHLWKDLCKDPVMLGVQFTQK